MPTTYKILGQAAPAAATPNNIYSVASTTQAVVSTIMVANTGAADTNFHIWVRPNSAAASTSNAIAYTVPITAYSTSAYTIGATLGGGAGTDILTVQSASGTVTFTVFGSELT